MIITIFHRNTRDEKVKQKCLALLILATEKNITLSTQEWLPTAIDLHYYVRIESPKEQPERFRKIEIYQNASQKPPYTYMVELGQEWSGFAENAGPKKEESA
jgi:hypothetical protein